MVTHAQLVILSVLRASSIAILAATIFSVSAPHGGAALLVAGDDIAATPVAGASGSLVGGPIFEQFAAASFSGELTSTVFQESVGNNPLGGLTFFYQFSNDSGSP